MPVAPRQRVVGHVRVGVLVVAGLVDTAGGLVLPSLHLAQPTLFSRPVFVSVDMPAAAANARSVCVGDFRAGYSGRGLYAVITKCSGRLFTTGLRNKEDTDRILCCEAHSTRLRRLHPRDKEVMAAYLNRAFGRTPEEALLLRLCSVCDGTYPDAGRSTGKCPDCQRAYEREKSGRRRGTGTAVRVRNTAAWQRARAQARARDGGCVLRFQGGCHGALSVHHRVPLEQGGTNLETLCRLHHEQAENA